MQLQRQQRTLEFDLGEQKLTVTLETAGRLGAWKRDDYRDAIENHLFPGKQPDEPMPTWAEMSRTERYRYMLHLHEGSAIAGSLVKLTNGEEETDALTPDLFEWLPDAVAQELLAAAYRLNPHWMPQWAEGAGEADQDKDPKGAATPTG